MLKRGVTWLGLLAVGCASQPLEKQIPPTAPKTQAKPDVYALLAQAATLHQKAKDLRERGLAKQDVWSIWRARLTYKRAGDAYRRYLAHSASRPAIERYEVQMGFASCLYFSGSFVAAAKAYLVVRDSKHGKKHREDAALFAIKAYEAAIEAQEKKGTLIKPHLPSSRSRPRAPIRVPALFVRLQKALDDHVRLLPSSPRNARLAYIAGEIAFRFFNFDEARERFRAVYKTYCHDPMAINAAQALLVSFKIDNNLPRMTLWGKEISSGRCSRPAASRPAASRPAASRPAVSQPASP
jgi:hypothetical protein